MPIKRLLSYLILSTTVLLWGCAHTGGTSTESSPTPALERILQKQELVVGTAGTMPPLNMTTKEGDVIGLEADVARLMSKAMGVELRLQTMPFAELLPALEAGRVDMVMSGMTITPRRNLKAVFVGPYLISGKCFLTKIETIASVEDPAQINTPDTTLAALKGSTSQAFVEKVLPKAKLTTTADYDEGVDLVLRDKVGALVADYPICLVSLARYPQAELVSVITRLTYEPIGIALPPGDPLLVNWVQNFLQLLEDTGELNALKETWLEDASWLRRLPSASVSASVGADQ